MFSRIGVRVMIVVFVATVGCDRVTKHVATAALAGEASRSYLAETIRLEYVENAGGFLSLGASLPPTIRAMVFTIGTALILFFLAVAAIRFQWRSWQLIAVSLIFSGAMSNWLDRVIHGSVVDFINIGIGQLRTGIFNVADVAILLGAALLLFSELGRRDASPSI
jgi:signal peptidase II